MTEKELHTTLAEHFPIKTKKDFRSVAYLIADANKRFSLAEDLAKLEEWVLKRIKDDRFRIRIKILFENISTGYDAQYLKYSRESSVKKIARNKKKEKKKGRTVKRKNINRMPYFEYVKALSKERELSEAENEKKRGKLIGPSCSPILGSSWIDNDPLTPPPLEE